MVFGVRQHVSTVNRNVEIEMHCSSGHYQQVISRSTPTLRNLCVLRPQDTEENESREKRGGSFHKINCTKIRLSNPPAA